MTPKKSHLGILQKHPTGDGPKIISLAMAPKNVPLVVTLEHFPGDGHFSFCPAPKPSLGPALHAPIPPPWLPGGTPRVLGALQD